MFAGRQSSPPKEPVKNPEDLFADLQSASKVADSLKKLENAVAEQVSIRINYHETLRTNNPATDSF